MSDSVLRPINRLNVSHQPTALFAHDFDEGVDPGEAGSPSPAFHYEALAYILTSAGARKLVAMIAEVGFVRPVDHMLLKFMRRATVVAAYPPIAVAPPARSS